MSEATALEHRVWVVSGSGMKRGAGTRYGGAAPGPPTRVPCLALSMLRASPEPPLLQDAPADTGLFVPGISETGRWPGY